MWIERHCGGQCHPVCVLMGWDDRSVVLEQDLLANPRDDTDRHSALPTPHGGRIVRFRPVGRIISRFPGAAHQGTTGLLMKGTLK